MQHECDGDHSNTQSLCTCCRVAYRCFCDPRELNMSVNEESICDGGSTMASFRAGMDTLSASDQRTITEPRQAPASVAQAAIATPHARHEQRGLL